MDNFGVRPLGQHGGPRPGSGRPRKGEVRGPKKPQVNMLTGSAYIVARLARDARDGCREAGILLAAIHDGRISAYAAGCEMNYRKRAEPTGRVEYPNVTRTREWAMHRVFNPRPNPKALHRLKKKKGPLARSGPEAGGNHK
jgi:hypothetical protein